MSTFGELFTKYRLKAEFISLSAFADAFAEKGYFYEISLFCHWQKGRRIPTKRTILIALVSLFVERGVIHTVQEANEFLESAGHGYFTKRELTELFATYFGKLSNNPHYYTSGSGRKRQRRSNSWTELL